MDNLALREKEIFEALARIKKHSFVIIGGYAVNAYALPRFSVDCDIVVKDETEMEKIGKELENSGYAKRNVNIDIPYHGNFIRYERTISKNFAVSMDILVRHIIDRQTNSKFTAEWVLEHSSVKKLRGKTFLGATEARVIDIDALIVMKLISCRETDIRDIFMMAPNSKNIDWIKEEVMKRTDFESKFGRLKSMVISARFKDNLQGVFGYVDKKIFDKHLKAVMELK